MKKISWIVEKVDHGQRIDKAIVRAFNEDVGVRKQLTEDSVSVSRGQVRAWIQDGRVYINDKRTRILSYEVKTGARVAVFWESSAPSVEGASAQRVQFELTESDILFEDDFMIAFNKPAGLPTQGTVDPNRDHLYAAGLRFMQTHRRGSQLPYLALHHRLDRDTSGIVVMAKAKEINKGLADLFKRHEIRKTYLAFAEKQASAEKQRSDFDSGELTVENHLRKKSKNDSRMISVHSGGDLAITKFRVTDVRSDFFVIEAMPKTGRMHQIRVHLSELGHPILGDRLYGAPRRPEVTRVFLHAHRLTFTHPHTRALVKIESPLPEDMSAYLIKQR